MRNAELEEDLRKNTSATNELRNEVKVLQADNVKLYEKMRFLQSYDHSNASASASGSKSLYPPGKTKEKDDDLGKYKSMYEQSMNPFEAFRGKVSLPSLVCAVDWTDVGWGDRSAAAQWQR